MLVCSTPCQAGLFGSLIHGVDSYVVVAAAASASVLKKTSITTLLTGFHIFLLGIMIILNAFSMY